MSEPVSADGLHPCPCCGIAGQFSESERNGLKSALSAAISKQAAPEEDWTIDSCTFKGDAPKPYANWWDYLHQEAYPKRTFKGLLIESLDCPCPEAAPERPMLTDEEISCVLARCKLGIRLPMNPTHCFEFARAIESAIRGTKC